MMTEAIPKDVKSSHSDGAIDLEGPTVIVKSTPKNAKSAQKASSGSKKSSPGTTGAKRQSIGKVPAKNAPKVTGKRTSTSSAVSGNQDVPSSMDLVSLESPAPPTSSVPASPPSKVYPQVDLARTKILDGAIRKSDEALARDVVRGGGIVVKGERIEFWYDPKDAFVKPGISEMQQTLPVVKTSTPLTASVDQPTQADQPPSSAESSTNSTPVVQPSVKPSKPASAKSSSAAKKKQSPAVSVPAGDLVPRWIRGTISSSNKSKYTATIDVDIPFRSAKSTVPGQVLKTLIIDLKIVRWKLTEYVSATYSGPIYQPRSDQKPSVSGRDTTSERIIADLVYTDKDCGDFDLIEMKKEFLRSRKMDPNMRKTYSFKYVIPAKEQAEMDELKKTEKDGIAALNRELRMKTDEIQKRVVAAVSELDNASRSEIEPLELKIIEVKKEIDFERDEKTASLESTEGRTSGTGMSIRVQKKMIDDHHKNRWTREVVPLERQLDTLVTGYKKLIREVEVGGRDEISVITAKRDEYVSAVKNRQQALRDKWKKLAEDDVNAMRLSSTIRGEKEWLLIRKSLAEYLPNSKHPVGLLKGIDSVCNCCKLSAGYQFQSGKCDECWKFSIYQEKIEELELRVPWANNRTSSEFTPYHVFYHEKAREIRIEKPNIEPALISQQCKEEWKRMAEDTRNDFERKRQRILLELVENLDEQLEDEESQLHQKFAADMMDTEQPNSLKRQSHESVLKETTEIDSEDESDEACTKCLSLKNPQFILQCDRTEGEPLNADDDRICGGMLHTYCCEPALAGVPPGDWFCSWLCKWIQAHKPVNAKKKMKSTNAKRLEGIKSITDQIMLVDDESSENPSTLSTKESRQNESVQVRADVAIAKRNRLEFILSQWEKIQFFMTDAFKVRSSLESKFLTLDNQLSNLGGSDGIKLRDKITSSGVPFPIDSTPAYVEADMRTYQLEGLSWFIDQHDKGANSIMGDEMGLGKTLQTLSFFSTLHHYIPFFSPFLVVCPLSVLPNWIAEAKRWTPQLHVVGLYGPQQERERIKGSILSGKNKDSVHLIVTTYEILLTEISWLRSQFYFRYFVLDEAQKIKNTDALVTQACRQIRSVYRVLLTGTPLQNNLTELWSLLNFLYPEVFTANTVGRFASAYDSSTTSENTSENMIKNDSFMRECHKLLEPIMLRRLKQNVLSKYLPPKTEIVLSAPLSATQKFHYKQVLKTVTGLVRNVGYKNVSSLLWQLWKCCLHPFLFEGVEESLADGSHAVDNQIVWMSGKMCLLDSLLEKLFAEQSKCLVYSQYTSMLDIIEEYCQWRGWKYLRLDGSTSLARRRFYMHMFNKPVESGQDFLRDHYFVFLVSTKAGGVGVNLQAANSVILYDSSWNPFVDAQAEDRAHRMGQKKEVTVYRLITRDTCEERIRFFAQQKLKMKEFVLNEDANGEKQVVEAGDMVDPASADVSNIYSAEQLKDILEYGSEELLKPGADDEEDGLSGVVTPGSGEKFYDACRDMLYEQLKIAEKVKGGSELSVSPLRAKPPTNTRRNICIRKYGEEDYTQTRVERTTEMDWLDIMEEENVVQRNRKTTTVTVQEKGVGKIQVSKWSIEEAEKERLQVEREKARIEAKKIGGNKRVTEHDMSCLHCHESVLKQRVIVTTEIDEEGKEVKKRKIDSDNSGYQACPICPATLHYTCLRLACFGSDFTVRSNCPQHKCRICRRSASNAGGLLFRCVDCPMALCYDCIEKYELVEKFEFLERDKVKWETQMGYTAASTYEYMHCPECIHGEQVKLNAIKKQAEMKKSEEVKLEDVSMTEPIQTQAVSSAETTKV